MKRPILVGNWKMHGSKASIEALLNSIILGIEKGKTTAEIVVCPPFPYLEQVARAIEHTPIRLGAQNVNPKPQGAFTGEVSPGMLRDFGCHYVIVGHSERRLIFQETDQWIAEKVAAVVEFGMTPIFCVGETYEQRQRGLTQAIVKHQLEAVLERGEIQIFDHAIIAYEPVWAIGTGQTATPEQAQEIHSCIRQELSRYDAQIASRIPILYGGSVNLGNIKALFAMADINGGLIGGAALKADEFIHMCESVGH